MKRAVAALPPAADPYRNIAEGEEHLAAACAAVADRLAQPDVLHKLSGEHLRAATELCVRPRKRWRELRLTLLVTLALSVGGELGALTWLRRQEQRLVDEHTALAVSPRLAELDRQRVRRRLVPGAFARFAQIDRLIQEREQEGVYV
jgi:hypothetical protein